VHFYALIYAHAYTKNNPVSKLKDNKRSTVLQASLLLDGSLLGVPIPSRVSLSLSCRRSRYLLQRAKFGKVRRLRARFSVNRPDNK